MNPTSSYAVGARVTELRGDKSQEKFAEALGVATSTLGGVETGRQMPGRVFLAALAAATRCNVHWLLTGEGAPLVGSTEPARYELGEDGLVDAEDTTRDDLMRDADAKLGYAVITSDWFMAMTSPRLRGLESVRRALEAGALRGVQGNALERLLKEERWESRMREMGDGLGWAVEELAAQAQSKKVMHLWGAEDFAAALEALCEWRERALGEIADRPNQEESD